MERASASSGGARSGLLVAADPDDETGRWRILATTKTNLAEVGSSLAYHLEESPNGSARVVWDGPARYGATTLLATEAEGAGTSAVTEAEEFLWQELADGPNSALEVQSAAQEVENYSAALRRVRAWLGVMASRQGFGRGGHWEWSLSPTDIGAKAAQRSMDITNAAAVLSA